jgi:plastocyanin
MSTVIRWMVLLAVVFVPGTAASDGSRKIVMRDDCDPTDPAWTPTGGCVLPDGDVTFAEFSAAVPIGHPAWRNDPSYLKFKAEKDVKVANEGGREHTFTHVENWGGGIVPPLNLPGQATVPECQDFGSSLLPPGTELRVENLEPGVHKFQCCFHPWMRAEIRVGE